MRKKMIRAVLFFVLSILSFNLYSQKYCPVPLYTDPYFKGAADPEVIWNDYEKEWWMFYTSRRAVCENAPLPALAIGVATSKDWIDWKHKGYIKIDGIGGAPEGSDILWAPGIIKDGNSYHMFLTFKKGNGRGGRWGIPESLLLHLEAPHDNLLYGWQTCKILHVPFSSIDATLILHKGVWNLFHRDIIKEKKGVNIFRVSTNDLNNPAVKWKYHGAVKGDVNNKDLTGYRYQEAPYVFYWKDSYWMLTDNTSGGFPLYKSEDLEKWKFMGELLDYEGEDKYQKGNVRHPGVVVIEDRAFVFYFCQPFMKDKKKGDQPCYIHVTELFYKDGNLHSDRNKKVLPPENLELKKEDWGFVGMK